MKVNANILIYSFVSLLFFVKSDVLNIDENNFDKIKQENKFLLILFHANWSDSSRNFLYDFANLNGRDLMNGKVTLGIVEQKSSLIKRLKINKVPTVILMERGKEDNDYQIYRGKLKGDHLADWVER